MAKWRMREMKRIFRERLTELEMLIKSLSLFVSEPSAIVLLRQAARATADEIDIGVKRVPPDFSVSTSHQAGRIERP